MATAEAIKKYGAQLVVSFAQDGIIRQNANTLCEVFRTLGWGNRTVRINLSGDQLKMDPDKGTEDDVPLFKQFADKLAESGGKGRIYLTGHGDWAMQTLGGANAEWVAEALKQRIPKVRLISVLGCSLGRDLGAGSNLVATSMDSFASKLHGLLRSKCDEVYARVFDLVVGRKGIDPAPLVGTKGTGTLNRETGTMPDAKHHRTASKLRFYWVGSYQARQWVAYKGDNMPEEDEWDRMTAL